MDYLGLIIGFIAGACGSLLLWVTLGRKMMLKYAGESVINAFNNPSPELQKAISSLMGHMWAWLNTPSLEIEGPKDEDGKVSKIKISPMQNVMQVLIQEIVNKTLAKLRGASGAAQRDANRLEGQLGQALGLPPLPRKGQSTGEFLIEQLGNRLMPMLEQRITTMMENTQRGGDQIKNGLR